DVFAGKKSAQIREILISESAWEEMTCLFAPSLDYELASHSHKLNNLHEFCWYKCEHAADSSIDQGHPLPSGLVTLLP
ncbi:hypothetical protein ACP8ZW_22485, partial [Escherichia coli]